VDEFIIKSTKRVSLLLSPHKVDGFLIKSRRWTSLLLSPRSGRIYYQVYKMDKFTQSTKWTNLSLRSTKWTSLLRSP